MGKLPMVCHIVATGKRVMIMELDLYERPAKELINLNQDKDKVKSGK